MEAIEVSHLTFSYDGKNDILKDVSFSIPKGSYTTIIGHNGSGKSTMAKLIIGLLEAKKGKIQILGQELNEESVYELRSHVGIVFQNPDNQFIGSTVADDIAFGLENHCVEQEKMQGIIEDVASRVGMTDFLSAEPTKLSGGQKQRVAIAGILAIEPDIIILMNRQVCWILKVRQVLMRRFASYMRKKISLFYQLHMIWKRLLNLKMS